MEFHAGDVTQNGWEWLKNDQVSPNSGPSAARPKQASLLPIRGNNVGTLVFSEHAGLLAEFILTIREDQ